MPDVTGPPPAPPASPLGRVAVFGGVYNNHRALAAVLDDAARASVDAVICLGDVGAFGPHPDRSIELLRERAIPTVQGNYDHSVGHGLGDCACGYSDPRDDRWAQVSYDYTLQGTSPEHRAWLRALPPEMRVRIGTRRVVLCHGSPRRTNEFLWESTTPVPFLARLLREADVDWIVCTHTGLPWVRHAERSGARGLANVGAIGRPDNDGDPAVHWAILTATPDGDRLEVEIRRTEYDHEALAREMEAERLPAEFVATIRTGWWTTCLEVLPAKERARSRC